MTTIYGTVRGNGVAHPAYIENDKIEICCSCPNTANGKINKTLFSAGTSATCRPGKWTVTVWTANGRIGG